MGSIEENIMLKIIFNTMKRKINQVVESLVEKGLDENELKNLKKKFYFYHPQETEDYQALLMNHSFIRSQTSPTRSNPHR